MKEEIGPLPVVRAAEIDEQPPRERWLIRPLWGKASVGIVGGPPKSCKTWLALDMALSVASATPCLGRFEVEDPGPALVYLAEDDLSMVRSRIECLCRHRRLDIRSLDLHVITEPSLRLDLSRDQNRLASTLHRLLPRLLLLDPLIRLHRLDENSATEISGLLSFFRELQRRFACAVLLVHHTSKRRHPNPGQSLRGSSDLHAFGDSNAYLERREQRLVMTIEHRAARTPDAMVLQLVSDPEEAVHLELEELGEEAFLPAPSSLAESVLRLLAESTAPLSGVEIRRRLRVNNRRLGRTLRDLDRRGEIERNGNGWGIPPVESMEGRRLLFG